MFIKLLGYPSTRGPTLHFILLLLLGYAGGGGGKFLEIFAYLHVLFFMQKAQWLTCLAFAFVITGSLLTEVGGFCRMKRKPQREVIRRWLQVNEPFLQAYEKRVYRQNS